MQIFGFDIRRVKKAANLSPVPSNGGGWFNVIREPFTGAWQRNQEWTTDGVLAYNAVYACVSLIASDIGKIGLRLMKRDDTGIWSETTSPAFSPVLRRPNRYQNIIKFLEQWVTSKLINGNTYVLKNRDGRGVVTSLYILDPNRCKPLVAPDGEVFYELRRDDLSGVQGEPLVVPASEIIHDTMVSLYHPLCGVSPITACGLAASQGLRIQENSAAFFANGSNPGAILSAPGDISPEDVERVRTLAEQKYHGANSGRILVTGSGLTYQPMTMSAVDAQLIEQLKWTAETVCSVFHVPAYMIGVGPVPLNNNVEALGQQYYSQCLQNPIESIEACLDHGLALPADLGVELNLDNLLRMDTAAKVHAAAEGIGAGLFSPNEQRRRFDLPPVEGGDTPYLQQQNFSLAALNKRDQAADPFATGETAPPAPPPEDDGPTLGARDLLSALVAKRLTGALNARHA